MQKHSLQDVKSQNKELLLKLIFENPDISRLDLANLSGLSGGTITSLVNELMQESKIHETAKMISTGGRRKTGLKVVSESGNIIIFEIKQRSLVQKIYDSNDELIIEEKYGMPYMNGNFIVEKIIEVCNKRPTLPLKIGILIEENIRETEISYMVSTGVSQENISLESALRMFTNIEFVIDYSLKYSLNEEVLKVKFNKVERYAYISVDYQLNTQVFEKGNPATFVPNTLLQLVEILTQRGLSDKWATAMGYRNDLRIVTNAEGMDVYAGSRKSKGQYLSLIECLAIVIETMLLFYRLDAIFLTGKAKSMPTLDQDLAIALNKKSKSRESLLIKTIVEMKGNSAKNMHRVLMESQLIGG